MDWLLYGANGYTGELVARLAVARGLRPILAGRRAEPVARLAVELALDYRVADLASPADLARALDGVAVVAHCAGPFSATAAPMARACLAAGVHYLDVTGEVDVFEWIFTQSDAARDAGVVLLPGAGFDVVPTDCVAVSLARALPGATHLDLAFLTGGGMSRGTTLTGLAGVAEGGRRRVDGALVATPLGAPRRVVPFPRVGSVEVGAIPWGDLATAYRSTGIPNITTYTRLSVPGAAVKALGIGPVRWLAGRLVRARVSGPDPATRARTRSEVWGEVRDGDGRTLTATLVGPNGYDLTADSVVRAVEFLGAGSGPAGPISPGAHTPATAFGPDYVALLDGVTVSPPG